MVTDNKDIQVRNDILAAAKRVFQRWGVNKTTMEDIASEAGRGKSTLYYYFKSKDEIIERFLFEELAAVVANAQSRVPRLCSARRKLRIYISSMLTGMHETASLYPLVKGDLRGDREFIERLSHKVMEEQQGIVLGILTEGLVNREFNFLDKYPLERVARVLVVAINGVSVQLILEGDHGEDAELLAKLIVAGL